MSRTRTQNKIYMRQYRQLHKEELRIWSCAHRKRNREKLRKWYKKFHKANRDRRVKERKERNKKIKFEVFSHYCKGLVRCQCKGCPIKHIDLLTLDHKIPVRKTSRRRKTGYHFWFWLKRNGCPDGFQILCASCNFSKKRNFRCSRYGKTH